MSTGAVVLIAIGAYVAGAISGVAVMAWMQISGIESRREE